MRVKPISGFYIDLKKSEKYSKVEECNMSTNCVGTYEQYKERLLKMKPNVYLHGQKIDRAGQALDRQHQAVKLPVMVGMRIFRQSIQRAGERNAVGCIFHSSTSFSSYEKLYEA